MKVKSEVVLFVSYYDIFTVLNRTSTEIIYSRLLGSW